MSLTVKKEKGGSLEKSVLYIEAISHQLSVSAGGGSRDTSPMAPLNI